jgi:hypothetical protein
MEDSPMSAGTPVAARPLSATLALLGICAAGLLLVRFVTEDIHVPGHSALPALFFLVYAAKRVPHSGAAGAVALPTIVAAQLGFVGGAGGVASMLSIAALVEGARLVKPDFASSVAACAVVGLLAGAARLATQLVPLALGLPDTGAPALASVLGFAAFGAIGAVLVPLADSRRGARAR